MAVFQPIFDNKFVVVPLPAQPALADLAVAHTQAAHVNHAIVKGAGVPPQVIVDGNNVHAQALFHGVVPALAGAGVNAPVVLGIQMQQMQEQTQQLQEQMQQLQEQWQQQFQQMQQQMQQHHQQKMRALLRIDIVAQRAQNHGVRVLTDVLNPVQEPGPGLVPGVFVLVDPPPVFPATLGAFVVLNVPAIATLYNFYHLPLPLPHNLATRRRAIATRIGILPSVHV